MQVYSLIMPAKSALKVAADPADLLGCSCMWLRKATRRLSQIYDQHLEPLGLTITQYGLLARLSAADGIGVGAFAEQLVMDPTTLTRNLRPLERQRLLVLAPDPRDRRSRMLHLTARGRERLAEARPVWARAQRQIEDSVGREDVAALHASLGRLLDRLAA